MVFLDKFYSGGCYFGTRFEVSCDWFLCGRGFYGFYVGHLFYGCDFGIFYDYIDTFMNWKIRKIK